MSSFVFKDEKHLGFCDGNHDDARYFRCHNYSNNKKHEPDWPWVKDKFLCVFVRPPDNTIIICLEIISF